jgi:Ca2+-binding RTX toxin-like protein
MKMLSISRAVVSEGSGARLDFVVTLSAPAEGTEQVQFRTKSGTALAASDFIEQFGTLTFSTGVTSRTIQVRDNFDSLAETDESLFLELYNPVGLELSGGVSVLSATGWILDNDGTGSDLALQVSSPVLTEGSSGTRQMVFEISLSRPAPRMLSLDYTTTDGTALAGQDYVARAGTVVFAPGQTSTFVMVDILGDAVQEASETFDLLITPSADIASGASGAVGVATILNDDLIGNDRILGSDADDTIDSRSGDDIVFGFGGADTLFGGIGNDTVYGGLGPDFLAGADGNDLLFGGEDRDTLDGGSGNDRLDGEGADNLLRGGPGNDRYVIRSAGDLIDGEIGFSQGGGIDTVEAWIDYTLPRNVEILRLQGSANLNGTGGAAPEALVGNTGANRLDGGGGNDVLNGKAGDDTLIGGTGADSLVGEGGADVFVFTAVADSRPGQANRDFINGFERGIDRIDLSLIDANSGTADNDAFSFIGNAAFSGVAGQLRFFTFGGGNFNIVEADVNGDRIADMQIFVNLTNSMQESDFIL